jgi:hypothetical protein
VVLSHEINLNELKQKKTVAMFKVDFEKAYHEKGKTSLVLRASKILL